MLQCCGRFAAFDADALRKCFERARHFLRASASPAARAALAEREGLREARYPVGGSFDRRPAARVPHAGRRPLYQASLEPAFALHAPASRGPIGGEGGIRTPGTLASTSVFETDPFDHSGTSPGFSQQHQPKPVYEGGKYSRKRIARPRSLRHQNCPPSLLSITLG